MAVSPPNVKVFEVKEPTEVMIDDAVQLTVSLQQGDPSCKAWTGGAGDTYVATDEDGKLVGYAQFIPPGRDLFDSEDQRQLGFYDFVEKMSDEGKKYFEESLGRDFPKYLDESFGMAQSQIKTHFCNLVFVRPEYQKQGIATAMFNIAYDKAKSVGAVVALSTGSKENVPVYEHLGMTLKGHQVFASPWGDWPSWAFAKELGQQ